MSGFSYRDIDHTLIQELAKMVEKRESVVLLGARYGGKRHVMMKLRMQLAKSMDLPIIEVRFLKYDPVTTHAAACEVIREAVQTASGETETVNPDVLLDSLDFLHAKNGTDIILQAANVDGLPHHLSRKFLQEVRTRVEQGWLVAVLSGEHDFRTLVHGPNSEFTCAHQFVLKGFGLDKFSSFFEDYVASTNLEFVSKEEAEEFLWTQTGGNIYLLRAMLWSVLEARSRLQEPGGHASGPLSKDELMRAFKASDTPNLYDSHAFRRAAKVISREPECWDALQGLLDNGKEAAFSPEPGPLELAGVAYRDKEELRIASPLMGSFLKIHFTKRRLGDLYALEGNWKRAFEFYDKIPTEETIRPSGVNDRFDMKSIVNAFCASLYSQAVEGTVALRKHFVRGMRLLLGFPDGAVYSRDSKWHIQYTDQTSQGLAADSAEVLGLLPSTIPSCDGIRTIPMDWERFAILATFQEASKDRAGGVLFGDFSRTTVISIEREILAKQMLKHFLAANQHALSVEHITARLRVREIHIEIISGIFDSLGKSVLDVFHVLREAARGLRRLGYRRIAICLVDPTREWVLGEVDDSDEAITDVAAETRYRLDDPTADIIPYVIHTRRAKIVPDMTKEPLTNKDLVWRAGMRGAAIVPILRNTDEAIGTIHIERDDRDAPTQEEVDDLLQFGRKLAMVIAQAERVNMQQAALDRIPEPLVILDVTERLRFGNRAAHDLLGIERGWHKERNPVYFKELPLGDKVFQQVRKTLSDKQRFAHSLTLPKGHERGIVLSDGIVDWRNPL